MFLKYIAITHIHSTVYRRDLRFLSAVVGFIIALNHVSRFIYLNLDTVPFYSRYS